MPQQRARPREKYRPQSARLMDQVREVLRYHHYAMRTEAAYCAWIRKFIRFNGLRHRRDMGKAEIERFLSHLAINRGVAAATQNQALNSILFLYREVLDLPVADGISAARTRRGRRLPTVLTREEVARLLGEMRGVNLIMAKLLFGSGLRLMEVIRLRVHDLDFERRQILVRDAKGGKDRATVFPKIVHQALTEHLQSVRVVHTKDLQRGYGHVYLPGALARKLPGAARAWGWQYVFPARGLSRDRRGGGLRRHHIDETALQKAVRRAAIAAIR